MTQPTQVAVRELLDRVLVDIQVHRQDESVDLSEYRDVLLQARASNNIYDTSRIDLYDVSIPNQTLTDELRGIIEGALSHYLQDNKLRTAGTAIYGLSQDFSVETLLGRLLNLLIMLGSEGATSSFIRSVELDVCPYRRLTLVGGVTLEDEVLLYDGIRLLPLPDSGESPPATYPSLLPDSELRHRFKRAVVIDEDRTASPRFKRPDDASPFMTKSISEQALNFDPRSFCLSLSLATKAYAYVSMQWTSLPEDEFTDLIGSSAFQYVGVRSPENRDAISVEQVEEARVLYKKFKSLPDHIQGALTTPLVRLAESASGKGIDDRILDLGIALESLYLDKIERELSFRLGLRAAKHLEDGLEERKQIAKAIKDFYDLRSKIVHTGSPPMTASELASRWGILGSAQEVCRRSIRRVLDEGMPAWADLDLK